MIGLFEIAHAGIGLAVYLFEIAAGWSG